MYSMWMYVLDHATSASFSLGLTAYSPLGWEGNTANLSSSDCKGKAGSTAASTASPRATKEQWQLPRPSDLQTSPSASASSSGSRRPWKFGWWWCCWLRRELASELRGAPSMHWTVYALHQLRPVGPSRRWKWYRCQIQRERPRAQKLSSNPWSSQRHHHAPVRRSGLL